MKRIILFLLFFLFLSAAFETTPAGASSSWYTLESENFYIHYAEGYRELAEETARTAEQIHPVLTARLGHEPAGKTHVVLSDVVDTPGGMAYPAYFNVITLYTVPPAGYTHLTGLDGTQSDWLTLLLVHEYAHILHLDMAGGIFEELRRIFGHVPGLSTPNMLQNLAIIEGIATYEETVVASGRGAGTFWDMFLRAASVENELLALDQVLGYYDLNRWDPAGGAYLYGYSWIAHLVRLEGQEALREVLDVAAEQGIFGGQGAGLEEVVGYDLLALDRKWRNFINERYEAQVRDLQERGLTPMISIESTGWVPSRPRYSPSGRYLAYETLGGEVGHELRVREIETGEEWTLVPGAHGGFSWTPDGETVVYSAPVSEGGRMVSDLFAVDVDTGQTRRLTSGLRAREPRVAPDGERLAYIQLDGKQVSTKVKVAAFDPHQGIKGEHELWADGGRDGYYVSGEWHPDGDMLAVEFSAIENSGIYFLMGPDQMLPAESHPSHTANPGFSPDGRFLIFESDRSGVSNIYALDIEQSQLYQLTNVQNGVFYPQYSPDGKSLAVTRYTADGYEVAVIADSDAKWIHPYPPFEGEHWQRGIQPEERTVISGETKDEYGAFAIRPYSPIDTLIPTWWLPFGGTEEDGLFGITTAMSDARRRHFYSLAFGVGQRNENFEMEIKYRWHQYPWTQGGWDIDLGFSGASAREQDSMLSSAVGYTFDTGENWQLPALHRLYGGVQLGFGGARTESGIVFGGWQYSGVDQAGRRIHLRQLGLQAESILNDPQVLTLTARWREERRWRRSGSVGFAAGVGLTRREEGLFPRSGGLFRVRGLFPGEIEGSSELLRLSLEAEWPLMEIYRGQGLWPVFFEELSISPFGDLVYAPSNETSVGSVGVALKLDTLLGFGSAKISPWIGVTRIYGGAPENPPVRLLGGLQF